MVSLDEEDKQPGSVKIKIRQGAEGTHSSEPQKAHPTGEFVTRFVIVA